MTFDPSHRTRIARAIKSTKSKHAGNTEPLAVFFV